MSPFDSWPAPVRAGPSEHLGRLHADLVELGGRLREAVAQAVSRAAADAVRQAALALLGGADSHPSQGRVPLRGPHRPASLYDRFDGGGGRDPYETEDSAWGRPGPDWGEPDEEARAFPSSPPRAADTSRVQPSRQLLAAALQALAWCSRRLAGRCPAGAALGFGVACGLALYLGGAALGGGPGMALALLADAVRLVASALGTPA